MPKGKFHPDAIVVYTGTTKGHEHYHGTITIRGYTFTYAAMPKRCGVGFIAHGICHAWSLEHLSRKLNAHVLKAERECTKK